MARARFLYSNLVDSATISAVSESATLPANNVAHNLRSRVYRTGNTVATERLVFDLASAQAVTCVVLLDHNLTASDTGIKLMGNTADSWGTPAFTQTLTRVAGPISAFFASQSYRYWAIEFTKSLSTETRDIGRIFIGTYYELTQNMNREGIEIKQVDLSAVGRAVGGQTYSDIRSIYDKITMNINMMPHAQHEQIRNIVNTVGKHTPFFISIDNDAEPEDWLYYVKISSANTHRINANSSTWYWSGGMTLDEQL